MNEKVFQVIDDVIDSVYEGTKWYLVIGISVLFLIIDYIEPKALLASIVVSYFGKISMKHLRGKNKWLMMALSGIIGMIPAFIIYQSWHIVIGLVYFGFVFYYMIQLRNNPLYFDDEKQQLALIIFVVGVITILLEICFTTML